MVTASEVTRVRVTVPDAFNGGHQRPRGSHEADPGLVNAEVTNAALEAGSGEPRSAAHVGKLVQGESRKC